MQDDTLRRFLHIVRMVLVITDQYHRLLLYHYQVNRHHTHPSNYYIHVSQSQPFQQPSTKRSYCLIYMALLNIEMLMLIKPRLLIVRLIDVGLMYGVMFVLNMHCRLMMLTNMHSMLDLVILLMILLHPIVCVVISSQKTR